MSSGGQCGVFEIEQQQLYVLSRKRTLVTITACASASFSFLVKMERIVFTIIYTVKIQKSSGPTW